MFSPREKDDEGTHQTHLWFATRERVEFINITGRVEEPRGTESGVAEGLCLVNAMHITASVYINDAESGLIDDYRDWLEELAPHEPIEPLPPQPDGRGQR